MCLTLYGPQRVSDPSVISRSRPLKANRTILQAVWRPEIGEEIFEDVKYSVLARVVDRKAAISKKTP
jgi:hypothetical protein